MNNSSPLAPLRLHLGCGEQYLDGYINIDYHRSEHAVMDVKADRYVDIAALEYPDNSVDEIRLHHVFEHFNRVTALALLIRWYKWLKPGGKLVIETPDLIGSAKVLLSDLAWRAKTATVRHLAGDQVDTWAYHVDHWFPERFQRTLSCLGFTDIQTTQSNWPHEPYLANVTVVAIKGSVLTLEELLIAADSVLLESTVSPSETTTFSAWQKQLRDFLSGGQSPKIHLTSAATSVLPRLSSHLPLGEILDFNQRSRDRWVADKAATVPSGLRVLDIGAGTCPYRSMFSHCAYKAHDFKKYTGEKLGGTTQYGNIDYVSEIESIPVEDASFDLILCTEVLEHVPEPSLALQEMARILRPGGRIFLTAPLGSGLHQLPYHYYGGFSPEWYRYWAARTGLSVVEIVPNGGFFKLLAQECARAANLIDSCTSLTVEDINAMRHFLSDKLPRFFFAVEDTLLIDQFTVGYHVELHKPLGTKYSIAATEFWAPADRYKKIMRLKQTYLEDLNKMSPEPHSSLLVIGFSKDRPMQLDAMLRSFMLHCLDFHRLSVRIIVKASNKLYGQAYQSLEKQYSSFANITLIPETDFRQQVLHLLKSDEYVLWLVDDNIFIQSFKLTDCQKLLKINQDALGYSLRLGQNTTYCYPLDKQQAIPDFCNISETHLKYKWKTAEYDFGYPLEVSSSLYRTRDLLPLLESIDFSNPNSLEGEMAIRAVNFSTTYPYLLCPMKSKTFCNPINKVQTAVAGNRAGNSTLLSSDALLDNFQKGKRINVAAFDGFTPNACHQEVAPAFIDNENVCPNVSVVIPCYNQAHFLAESVESVVAQTYRNWECIIVNDGSPDNASEVARELIERYPDHRIKLLEKPNGGLADARNFGIMQAMGTYILPLDSDDVLHPEMLKRTVEFLESHPRIAIIYTDLFHFGAVQRHVIAEEYDFQLLKYANQLNYCSIYRREVWEKVGGYNTNMTWGYEDWDFWIGAGERGYAAQHLPEALLFYRVKRESMFKKALEHDAELKAQIVMNHPQLYNEQERKVARKVLSKFETKALFVSVIVPTYNRPDMLKDTIQSILDQTYQDFEIIVVNDAGQDVSYVLQTFNSSKISCLSHEINKGLAAARNTGIRNAKGNYIALLDDDDCFYKDHLETAVEAIRSGWKVVYTNAVRAEYAKVCTGYELRRKHVPYSIDFDRSKLLLGNIAPVNCFVFEREAAFKAGLFDESFSVLEDWEFWIRLSAFSSFHHIKKETVQVNWRTDGTTMTSSRQAEFKTNRSRIYQTYQSEIAEIPNRDDVIQELNSIWSQDFKRDIDPVPMPALCPGMVSIVILTFNQLKYTKECVESIQKHTPELHEIIFVDNGSGDGTVKWLRKLAKHNSNFKLVENKKNLGFSKGCNQGIEAATGEFVLLLNNDVVVTESWLGGMLECVNSASDIGIVGPMTNSVSGPQKVPEVGYSSIDDLAAYARKFTVKNRFRRVPYPRIVGFCMLFKRQIVEEIGFLDESFGSGNFEDDDLCLRATLAGYHNMIVGDVFIHHYGSRSFIGNRIDYGSSLSGNRKIFNEKWSGIEVAQRFGKKLVIVSTINRAHEFYRKGQMDEAIATLLEGIKQTPGEKGLYLNLVELLIESKRHKDAFELLEAMRPDDADTKKLVLKGCCEEGLGHNDKAEACADRALGFEPSMPQALNLKGVVVYKRGERDTAESFFKKAIESAPSFGESYTNLGVVKWDAGEQTEALALFERGFILSPTAADTVTAYHSAVSDTASFARAEPVFREARALCPNDKRIAFFLIATLIQRQQHDRAVREIELSMLQFGIDEGILSAALDVRAKTGSQEIQNKGSSKNTLSLCMIVKNEEQHLARCLMSVKPIANEIIVVDTGSMDRTKNIALAFGAKVFDFTWTNDFSEARNYSLSKASGDWILVLDADEVISLLDHSMLIKITKKHPAKRVAYSMVTRNYTNNPGAGGWVANEGRYAEEEAGKGWVSSSKVRLFVNDKRIQFVNPVHELVEPALSKLGIQIKACDVPVHHYGRLDQKKVISKGKEYYRLGIAKIEQTKGDYNALRELAIQASEIGEYEEAVKVWRKVIELQPNDAAAHMNMGFAFLMMRQYDSAIQFSKIAMQLDPELREAALNYSGAEMIAGDIHTAVTTLEHIMEKHADYPPAMGRLAAAYIVSGRKEEGLRYLGKLNSRGFDCASVLEEQALAFMAESKLEAAVSLLIAAVEKGIGNGSMNDLLAECRSKIDCPAPIGNPIDFPNNLQRRSSEQNDNSVAL